MAIPDARPADFGLSVSKESSCHKFFIAGSISEATHMTSTRSCRGLAGPFIAVRSSSPQYVCNSRKVRTCLTATFVQLLFHAFRKRGTILDAEHNATLDMLSENGSCHAPACPAPPLTCHPSSYRPGHHASAPTGRDSWATTLAAFHQFSPPPDPPHCRTRRASRLSRSSRPAPGSDRAQRVDGRLAADWRPSVHP